jgi:hypothetical protein
VIKLNLQAQTLQRLIQIINPQKGSTYDFLGCTLDLKAGTLTDKLSSGQMENLGEWGIQLFSTLLAHYSLANPTPLSGRLVKFKDVPGGYAYEGAFIKRAIQPIADVFGDNPEELGRVAELLDGKKLKFGDASTEIPALKGIPLTYILWAKGEFPAEATILYDESASNYLPTEDLAGLGEIATIRLIEAKKSLSEK